MHIAITKHRTPSTAVKQNIEQQKPTQYHPNIINPMQKHTHTHKTYTNQLTWPLMPLIFFILTSRGAPATNAKES